MPGSELTSWTIRLSLLLFVIVLALRAGGGGRGAGPRWLWTAAYVAFLAHVACAFHFYHDWSHLRAWQHTAAETQALVGWRFGGGLTFNYACLLVWGADVAWWWLARGSYESRTPRLNWAVHGYLLFIALNGAVVFARGPVRWGGLVACLLLLLLYWRRIRGRTSRQPT